MLVVKLKGPGKNETHPVAVLMITEWRQENKRNNPRRQKLGPKYFWQLWARMSTDVSHNNDKMSCKNLPFECEVSHDFSINWTLLVHNIRIDKKS